MKPHFSYLHLGEKFNPKCHIIAVYRIRAKESFFETVEEVAGESSIGTWTEITHETEKRFKKLSAKVFSADRRTGTVKIAYPLELFEPGNIPQLLSSIAGNIFGMKKVESLRLEDIFLPERYVLSFPGPGVGLKGIYNYLEVKDRPILASIIKPKEGLPVKEHVRITKELFEAGIDLVKDDENLTSPSFNPFDKRLNLIMREIRQIKRPKLYAFNITAPCDLMISRAKQAKDAGSKCVMVDIVTLGFAALQILRRRFPDLIIHGHRAMHAVLTRNKKYGISMLVLAKLSRLAGVDELHTGTIIGKMEGEKKEVLKINKFLKSPWCGLKPVLPVASGGLYPALIPNLISVLGKKIVFAFGGGIHGHPQGAKAGAKAVIQAVEAVKKEVPLKDYAKNHQELKIALDRWGGD